MDSSVRGAFVDRLLSDLAALKPDASRDLYEWWHWKRVASAVADSIADAGLADRHMARARAGL